MKNSNNSKFFVGLKLYSEVYKAGAMVSLSNAKHLMAILKQVGTPIGILTLLSTREVHRFTLIHNFGVHILRIYKNHGDVFTVKYLKACQLAIQKKVAGTPLKTLREVEPLLNLPRLTTSGLPSVIRLQDRRSIGVGSVRIVRFWLSLFSIYRIIKIPVTPKLNTITDPFKGDLDQLEYFNQWLSSKASSKVANFRLIWSLSKIAPQYILPIEKASSLGGSSWSSLIRSWTLICLDTNLKSSIISYLKLTSSEWMQSALANIEFVVSKYGSNINDTKFEYLGRLAFKEEAAGKLRIFAMVDVITQSIMKPLHDHLFDFLRLLPNDGTHDQEKAFEYAKELASKYSASYGFDLSSATDRLPISSQESLLNGLFNSENFGPLWSSILVSRDYWITENSYSLKTGPLRYSVGQPMGALSSWAMLAITHHFMVQWCADKLGKSKFTEWYADYVVLGDDIVIFDKDVADMYCNLCKVLGVEINLTKSVIAPKKPVIEFAKRTAIGSSDVSALSFKDFISNNNFFGRLSLTSRLISRNYGKDPWKIFYLGNRMNLSKFSDTKYPLIGYLSQLASTKDSGLLVSDVLSLITSSNYKLSYFGRNISWLKPNELLRVVKSILNKTFKASSLDYTQRKWALINCNAYKLVLLKRIFRLYSKISDFNISKYSLLARDRAMLSHDSIFFKQLSQEFPDKSYELEKPLTSRWYYKRYMMWARSDKYSSFVNRIFSFLFTPHIYKHSPVSFRLLYLGLDVDLSRTTTLPLYFEARELLEFHDLKSGKTDFESLVKTKKFAELTVEYLLDFHMRLTSIVASATFMENSIKRAVLKEQVIPNPLKILDFIQESQTPENKKLFKIPVDFMIMDKQVVSGEWSEIDHKPGFKPKFKFGF